MTNKVVALLASSEGLPAAVSVIADVSGIALPPLTAAQIITQNVTPEIAERSATMKYPNVYVYCTKVTNTLREKFRTFSGEAEMTIEVRVSQDRLEGLESAAQIYVDAVTRVLDGNRGSWGAGVNYCGGYEIAFGPVKHGGRNFLQAAKVSFVADVSTN